MARRATSQDALVKDTCCLAIMPCRAEKLGVQDQAVCLSVVTDSKTCAKVRTGEMLIGTHHKPPLVSMPAVEAEAACRCHTTAFHTTAVASCTTLLCGLPVLLGSKQALSKHDHLSHL